MKEQKLKGENVSYDEYCAEICAREKREFESLWQVYPSLTDKVDLEGNFRPFFGDTVVYTLSSADQKLFYSYQQKLNASFSDLFAEPLDYHQFHITIHDLDNSPNLKDIRQKMISNKEQCKAILQRLRSSGPIDIDLKSTFLFPSRKTALLMGFVPESKRSYRKLLEVYNLFEQVRMLDYWPHLHVTINYFKPELPSDDMRESFYQYCHQISADPVRLKLDLSRIVYQHFSDMNHYIDII